MVKLILIFITVFSLLGCFSPPPTATSFFKIQRLEPNQAEKVEMYNSSTEKFFVDSFSAEGGEFMEIDPYSQSLATMKLVYTFGLEDFTILEKRKLATELFGKIPVDDQSAVIGNLVVSRWFENGEPLIVSVTKVCQWRKQPKIVVLTNTVPLMKSTDAAFVRKIPNQLVKYPQVIKQDADNYYLGGDVFEFLLEENRLLQDAFFVRSGDDPLSAGFRDFDEKILAQNLVGADSTVNLVMPHANDSSVTDRDKLWAQRGMRDTISLIRELAREQQ